MLSQASHTRCTTEANLITKATLTIMPFVLWSPGICFVNCIRVCVCFFFIHFVCSTRSADDQRSILCSAVFTHTTDAIRNLKLEPMRYARKESGRKFQSHGKENHRSQSLSYTQTPTNFIFYIIIVIDIGLYGQKERERENWRGPRYSTEGMGTEKRERTANEPWLSVINCMVSKPSSLGIPLVLIIKTSPNKKYKQRIKWKQNTTHRKYLIVYFCI